MVDKDLTKTINPIPAPKIHIKARLHNYNICKPDVLSKVRARKRA
jgi:hypothetical protein